tara:strand:- start:735 stop:962 length:228 start_codon:yes stop_codon:yes gene_type:complete
MAIIKDDLIDRLTTIRDSIDTDFLNRHDIEGVTDDINKLIKEVKDTHTIVDIDRDVSAEYQTWKNNRDQFNSECD